MIVLSSSASVIALSSNSDSNAFCTCFNFSEQYIVEVLMDVVWLAIDTAKASSIMVGDQVVVLLNQQRIMLNTC